jgi:hypothetical protein
MSPALPVAAILASALCVGIFFIVYRAAGRVLSKRDPRKPPTASPKNLGCIAMVVLWFPLFYGTLAGLTWAGTTHKVHVSYSEGAEMRPCKHLALPPEASDINYYSSIALHREALDFAVSEEGFRVWAARKGWRLKAIGNGGFRLWSVDADGHEGDVTIERGLCFSKLDDIDIITRVAYDEKKKRAYYSYLGF